MNALDVEARTRQAIDELRSIRCSDPAAADALDAIRLTVHTLETWWLPMLTGRLVSGTPSTEA